ncbi:hypothetical protein [Micromonospora sp. ALFpr18c]|uniref:hypothetical protein n=1 Tax=Micromonospora sp. NPDC050695 TaxID=3154938 RepID=UPI001788D663|nr:hypothetical protein [Micromonospora sp. ALFpr18c]
MKAHRTDLVSFAFGLVFLALSAWWLLAQLLGLALPPVGWFLAGALILIGVFGLVGALRSGRPSQPEPAVQATAPVSGASAPVSGAAAPVPGDTAPLPAVTVPTSGVPLPSWEADRSTWDTAPAPEAPTAEVIHPAWLAHPPAEPETTPVPGPARSGADEPTWAEQPVEVVDDRPADEREGRRTQP